MHDMSEDRIRSIVKSVIAKHLACGGMVKGMADGGMVEEEAYSESGDDLFSDDLDAPAMPMHDDKKERISSILKSIRMKKAEKDA